MESNYPIGAEVITDDDGIQKVRSRFYFFMASPPVTGGDLVIVDHAKALIAAGVDARFLYLPNKVLGTKISDFPPEVPVNMLPEVTLTPSDFLMSGESQGPLYRDIADWIDGTPGFPNIVMLNQAAHWLPYAFSCPNDINNRRMSGLICASEFIQRHCSENLYIDLNKVFKTVVQINPITVIPAEILQEPGSYERTCKKNKPKCRITYINNIRKRNLETIYLKFAFLSLYPEYKDKVEFVGLHKVPHIEVLTAMRRSDIFLVSGYMDSHNLPAVEAMAAGCHVLGYTGLLTDVDYLTDDNGWWFKEEGQTMRHIHMLKEAIDLYYATDKDSVKKRKKLLTNARQTVEQHFSPNSPNTQIVAGYRQIWDANLGDGQNHAVFATNKRGYFVEP